MRYQGAYADTIKVAETLLSGGDNTYTRRGQIADVRSGYAVGGAVPTFKTTAGSDSYYTLARWIEALPSTVKHLGTWHDSGVLYIDAVDIIDNYFDAVLLGIQRGEKAIYSFTSGVVETLPQGE